VPVRLFQLAWKQYRNSPERRITKEHAVQILQTAWERFSVTALESAWSIYQDYENQSDITRSRDFGQRRKVASTTKHRVLTRYEGIAIAGVLAFATEENPFVAIRESSSVPATSRKGPNSLGSPP
jgi:cation transport regulator ChaB